MIKLDPLPRRILYVTLFEILAIFFATILLTLLSKQDVQDNFPIAAVTSVAAIVWNFVYNTMFEWWETHFRIEQRTFLIRAGHSLGFELGLVVLLIPLYMWWYAIGPAMALFMEFSLLVFFLFYTFLFTWIFDSIFPRQIAEAR